MGRGGGQVVGGLAFYSDDPSSNPAETCNFFSNILLEKNENKLKRGQVGQLIKNRATFGHCLWLS